MKHVLPLLLLLLMAMPAQAAGVPLFDGYDLDMPRSAVQRRAQAEPCRTPGLEEHLCRSQPATFGGQQWQQVFMFSENRLKAIVLQRPFSPAGFRDAMQAIVGNGLVLAEINADGSVFDALAAARKGARSFESRLKTFEQQAAKARQLTYSFLDKRSLRAAGNVASLRQFLQQAPAATRGVTLSHNGRLMILTFLAPGA